MAYLGRAARNTGERSQWGPPPASWGTEQAFSLHRKAPFSVAFDDEASAIAQQFVPPRLSCGSTPQSQRTSKTRSPRSSQSSLKLGSLCSDLQTPGSSAQEWWSGGHLASVVAVMPKESHGPHFGWLGKSHRSQSSRGSTHRPGCWRTLPAASSPRQPELVTERRRVWKCGPFDEPHEPLAPSTLVGGRHDLNGKEAYGQPGVARCKDVAPDGVVQADSASTTPGTPTSVNLEVETSELEPQLEPSGPLTEEQHPGCPGISFSSSCCHSGQTTESLPIVESTIASCIENDCEASYVAESPSSIGSETPAASVPAAEDHADGDTILPMELPQEPSPPAKLQRRKMRRHALLRLLGRDRRRHLFDIRFCFVEWKRSLRRCTPRIIVLHSPGDGCAVVQEVPAATADNCDISCSLSSSWKCKSVSWADDLLDWSGT